MRLRVWHFVVLRRFARQRVRGAQEAGARLGRGSAGAADSSGTPYDGCSGRAASRPQVGVSSATSSARRGARRARAAARCRAARAGKRTGRKVGSTVDRAATLLGRIASLAGANEPERRRRGEESFRGVRKNIERHANRFGLENQEFPRRFARSWGNGRLATRSQSCEKSRSAFARTRWIVVDFSVFRSRFFSAVSPLLIFATRLKQLHECARMAE